MGKFKYRIEECQYAKRNQDDLEPYFTKHMDAMVLEGLNSKVDIASELAYRDKCIQRLAWDILDILSCDIDSGKGIIPFDEQEFEKMCELVKDVKV